MSILLVWILISGGIGFLEIKQLRKKNLKYDSWVFAVLLGFVTAYGMWYSMGMELFDPNAYVKELFGPIGNWMMQPVGKSS